MGYFTSVAWSAFELCDVFFKCSFWRWVLRSLKASPLIKPLLTPGGWQEEKCVYWKVSVGLKCVRTSRMDSFLNLSPLYTLVSRKARENEDRSLLIMVSWGKLFLYLKFQPWTLLSDDSYLLALQMSLFPFCSCSIEKRHHRYIFSKCAAWSGSGLWFLFLPRPWKCWQKRLPFLFPLRYHEFEDNFCH